MPPEILFVDDERMQSAKYRAALQKHRSVRHEDNALAAFAAFKVCGETLRAAVVDVMMPTPAGVDEVETAGTNETGLWLLGRMQAEVPQYWPLPVVILTNRLVSDVKAALVRREILTNMIEVHQKRDTRASELPGIVSRLIEEWHR